MSYFGETESSNPVEQYLSWKGHEEDWFFVFWDKDKEENVKIDLNEFIILKLWFSIWGYDKPNKKRMFSNEVQKLNKEQFLVKYRDESKTPIWEWYYEYIKDSLKAKGGKLQRVITAYDVVTGKIMKFSLSGTAFYEFGQFLKTGKRNSSRISYKGSVAYTVNEWTRDEKIYKKPSFEWAGDITENELEKCKQLCELVRNYDESFKWNYNATDPSPISDVEEIDKWDPDDDLPF